MTDDKLNDQIAELFEGLSERSWLKLRRAMDDYESKRGLRRAVSSPAEIPPALERVLERDGEIWAAMYLAYQHLLRMCMKELKGRANPQAVAEAVAASLLEPR